MTADGTKPDRSTIDLDAMLAAAKQGGDLQPLVEAIPCARFVGLSVERNGDELIGTLRYAPHLIGNSLIPALHGGTMGTLLESMAFFQLMWESDGTPRIVNITVEYLRTARAVDTFSAADITRLGRNVANVRVIAWQDDRSRPVAAANATFLVGKP
jgi:acyl-coenzyme A thioesterase PaaI-like protein